MRVSYAKQREMMIGERESLSRERVIIGLSRGTIVSSSSFYLQFNGKEQAEKIDLLEYIKAAPPLLTKQLTVLCVWMILAGCLGSVERLVNNNKYTPTATI